MTWKRAAGLFNWGLEKCNLSAAGDCNACEGSQAIRSGHVQLVHICACCDIHHLDSEGYDVMQDSDTKAVSRGSIPGKVKNAVISCIFMLFLISSRLTGDTAIESLLRHQQKKELLFKFVRAYPRCGTDSVGAHFPSTISHQSNSRIIAFTFSR